ncbi:MAG: hypothetical protein QM579_02945 [Desulfovibrio sp.]|uniref:hypothetical protein n=1 Tax=Desulfovibrio sp. TaxID=885 RepID=UPI0039E3BD30
MQTVLDDDTWDACQDIRQRQRKLGMVCAVLLAVALLCLVDGLQGLMRSGATVLELLPEKSAALSGPLTIKNPVTKDIEVSFTPSNAPLSFTLEGFFAGYWFGNGMWRGIVAAQSEAEPGEYHMRVAFRGAAASTFQNYTVIVRADAVDMRTHSTSFAHRLTGFNPFALAVGFVGLALLVGVGVYRQGSMIIRTLVRLGCGEIVRVQQEKDGLRLWCLLYGSRPPYEGTVCAVMTTEGSVLAHARAGTAAKGSLQLFIPDHDRAQKEPAYTQDEISFAVRPGCLVCLRPPCSQSPPAPAS